MHVKWLPDGDGSDSNLLSQQQPQSQQQQNQQLPATQHQPLIPNGHIFPPMSQMPPTHFASQQQSNNGEGLYRQLQPQVNRTHDDAMVSYIFQRNPSEGNDMAVQPQPSLAPQQLPPHLSSQQGRTAVPPSHLQGKFHQLQWPPSSDQIPEFARNDPQQLMYEAQLNGQTRMFHSAGPPPPQLSQTHPPPPLALMQQHLDMQQRTQQIAPSAKKLWGVEEVKEDGPKGILMNGPDIQCGSVWRDSPWSTSEHGVSPALMVTRRPGNFPTGETAGSILSPRSSETGGGLGEKMVEYVLGTSPTSKDLEPRMKNLVLNSVEGGNAEIKKEKDKAPVSPYDNLNSKKELENGPSCGSVVQQNGIVMMQNGSLDDDKAFKYVWWLQKSS